MAKKYELIRKDLLAKIANNEFKDNMLPTEYELVNFYNVSRVTVQKALSKLVSDNVIKRVAGKGTFITDNSKKSDKNIVTYICLDNNRENMLIFSGIDKILSPHGYYCILKVTNEKYEKEQKLIEQAQNDRLAGMILYPLADMPPSQLLLTMCYQNFPMIFVDRYYNGIPSSAVVSNGYHAAALAVRHLYENGHRKIGFFSHSPLVFEVLNERFAGFKYAMESLNLEINPEYTVFPPVETTREEADLLKDSLAEQILKLADPPTAIFCSNDISAIDIYTAANRLKLRIPEDISVVGHDNLEASLNIIPPLTTIEQPFQEIGKTAATLLLEQINGDFSKNSVISLAPNLLIRNSVAHLNE